MSAPDQAGALALLPYGTRVGPWLSRLSLDELQWPLGRPERLAAGTLADLGPDDHLLCYVSSRLLYMPRPGLRAKVSVMIVEPQAVHGRNMAWLRLLYWRFHRVLTCNGSLLAAIPNGRRYHFGSTWVPDWRDLDVEKTATASLIASGKTYYEGHKLRHRVVEHIRSSGADVAILGRGYRPFDRKSDGLAPYRYSVIIENVREPGYFTEKLIDCLLCETVPIYWGAQDIDTIFDPRGMIICDSFEDLMAALPCMSVDDYSSRLEFIRRNREMAAHYAQWEVNAARIVSEDLDARPERPR